MFDVKSPMEIWRRYSDGIAYKTQIDLFDTVERNEWEYVGDQWQNVTANGLPTPIVNFTKRIIAHDVSTIASDNIKVNASPLAMSGLMSAGQAQDMCTVINSQFDRLFEANKVHSLLWDFERNTAVDGDGCLYAYWEADKETGQPVKGDIEVEIIENTRVIFGNPNDRRVQKQPWIMITHRMLVDEAREIAEENGADGGSVKPDTDDANNWHDGLTSDKTTVVTLFWRDKKTKTVHALQATQDAIIRPEWDMELKLYPIVWSSWDFVQNSYHGYAAVTSLVPNQEYVNKILAMAYLSLMTTAYPKIVYDKTRIERWDNRVGAAIPINGGNVSDVVKNISGATVSPQVGEYISNTIEWTKDSYGATAAALGEMRNPDNTSAITASQRASSIPLEQNKNSYAQSVEDLAYIFMDFMRAYYGNRQVSVQTQIVTDPMTGVTQEVSVPQSFDFGALNAVPLTLKIDVGEASFWSEITTQSTLDNLLMLGKIDVVDYLERCPSGNIPMRQELVDKLKKQQEAQAQIQKEQLEAERGAKGVKAPDGVIPPEQTPIPQTSGNSQLQREIAQGAQRVM